MIDRVVIIFTIACLFIYATVIDVAFADGGFIRPTKAADVATGASDSEGLYNKVWEVIIARDGAKTAMTFAKDYKGDLKDFAWIMPVPVVLAEEDIQLADPYIFKRLKEYTEPRYVTIRGVLGYRAKPFLREYSENILLVCLVSALYLIVTNRRRSLFSNLAGLFVLGVIAVTVLALPQFAAYREGPGNANSADEDISKVEVKAEYNIGEYEIVILSARKSVALLTWLTDNGYHVSKTTESILQEYIDIGMSFFVARINLDKIGKDYTQLKPLRFTFETENFILPIKLGLVNLDKEQELLIYYLTPNDTMYIKDYPTEKITTGKIKKVKLTNAALLEYTGPSNQCGFCAAEPLTEKELKDAGVLWPGGKAHITRWRAAFSSRESFSSDFRFRPTGPELLEPVDISVEPKGYCSSAVKSDLTNYAIALEAFFTDHNRYSIDQPAKESPPGFFGASKNIKLYLLLADDKRWWGVGTHGGCAIFWKSDEGGLM